MTHKLASMFGTSLFALFWMGLFESRLGIIAAGAAAVISGGGMVAIAIIKESRKGKDDDEVR